MTVSTTIRITQNGKTRNYVSKIMEILQCKENEGYCGAVSLHATGRCVSKLVTTVEVVKSLISSELHQYTRLTTVPITEDKDIHEKSQLFVTLSLVEVPNEYQPGYQVHHVADAENDQTEEVKYKKPKSNRRKNDKAIKMSKKKNIEDEKNVLVG